MRTETPSGTAITAGAKLRIDATPGGDERVGHLLGGGRRRGDDPDRDPAGAHDLGQLGHGLDRELADRLADLLGVGVDEREHPEAPGTEAAVVGERVAEVADADDDDRPVVGEPELARDPVDQERDLVARRPGCRRSRGRRGPCALVPR